MIKLITPPGMLLTTALLAIYCAYAFAIWSIEGTWPLLTGGVLSVIAIYGVAMVRPWSRYLMYALTLGFFAKLGTSVYSGISSGYFEFQFGRMTNSFGSLLPVLLIALLSSFCCVIVHRQFRRKSPPAIGSGN